MAKFYGIVGYAKATNKSNGVWKDDITECQYFGDVIRYSSHRQEGENLNDNIVAGNTISIVADPYAEQNFQFIKYVVWMGAYWKVTNVEVQRPRLILTIGGVYNGKKGGSATTS